MIFSNTKPQRNYSAVEQNLMVVWIRSSVAVSTAAVASSRTRTFGIIVKWSKNNGTIWLQFLPLISWAGPLQDRWAASVPDLSLLLLLTPCAQDLLTAPQPDLIRSMRRQLSENRDKNTKEWDWDYRKKNKNTKRQGDKYQVSESSAVKSPMQCLIGEVISRVKVETECAGKQGRLLKKRWVIIYMSIGHWYYGRLQSLWTLDMDLWTQMIFRVFATMLTWGMIVSLALRSCRPMVVISLIKVLIIFHSSWILMITCHRWWQPLWLVQSSWTGRDWDSTSLPLSSQRCPPWNFHHHLLHHDRNHHSIDLPVQCPILNISVPTFSLSETSKLKLSRTHGSSGRYLVAYPSNLISPYHYTS